MKPSIEIARNLTSGNNMLIAMVLSKDIDKPENYKYKEIAVSQLKRVGQPLLSKVAFYAGRPDVARAIDPQRTGFSEVHMNPLNAKLYDNDGYELTENYHRSCERNGGVLTQLIKAETALLKDNPKHGIPLAVHNLWVEDILKLPTPII